MDSELLHSTVASFELTMPTREQRMSEIIRPDGRQLVDRAWTMPVLIGILVACVLGFIASYPATALWVSNAAQAEVAGAASPMLEPVPMAKKPVRYEAVINNWKRYRSFAAKPRDIAASTATEAPMSGNR